VFFRKNDGTDNRSFPKALVKLGEFGRAQQPAASCFAETNNIVVAVDSMGVLQEPHIKTLTNAVPSQLSPMGKELCREAQNMAKRFRLHGEACFRFITTCALQGRSAFEFILQAVQSRFRDEPAPSFLPAPT